MFSQITNIFRKEWLEFLRDRRTFLTLFVMAFAAPLYIYFLIDLGSKRQENDEAISAILVGEEQAPNLKQFLIERNVEFKNHNSLNEAQSNAKTSEVIVVFESNFRDNYENSLPATVSLYVNQKDDTASGNVRQIRTLLRAYNEQIEAARLIARGVSPARIQAIDIEEYDLTSSGRASNLIAGLILYMFIATAFAGTIATAADLIAGEKERQTLQPLLAQPVTRSSLVIGKWLTLALLGAGFCSIAFMFGGFIISKAPLAEAGVTFHLGLPTLVIGALSLACLAMFATAFQIFIASKARTYREAMTYLPWTALVPFAVTFVPLFTSIEYGGLVSYAPIFNQTFVLRELLLEGSAPPSQLFGGFATSIGLAILFLALTIQSFGNEKSFS